MAKSGETVENLYVSLGLDISELTSDFVAADATVNQALARLNRESNAIKLKAEIDINGLDNIKDAEQIARIQMDALNKQIALQSDRVKLATAAWKQMVQTKGEQSKAAQAANTAMLREQATLSRLTKQMREYSQASQNAAKNTPLQGYNTIKGNIGNVQNIISNMTASTDTAITQTLSLIGELPSAWAAAGVAIAASPLISVATQKGIIELARPAADAAANIKDVADLLRISNEEAAKFSKMMTLGGADAMTAAAAIARLDKSILSAGAEGNATTKMLEMFGAKLTDNTGKLLPFNQQLQQLAQGYKNAGLSEDFLLQTLGSKGLNLAPILRDFDALQERVKNIHGTGLVDIEQADRVSKKIAEMDMQMAQLKGTVSQAMIPIAEELLPDFIKNLQDVADWTNQNKDAIKLYGVAAGDALAAPMQAAMALKDALSELKAAASDVTGISLTPTIDDIQFLRDKNKFAGDMAAYANMIGGPLAILPNPLQIASKLMIDDDALAEWKAQQAELAEEAKRAAEETAAADEARRKSAEEAAKALQNEQEGHAAAVKNIEEADKLRFDAEHNAYERSLRDIDEWQRKALESARTGEERASIMALAAEKIKAAEKEVQDAIDKNYQQAEDINYKANHNATENAIYDIERQKDALMAKARTAEEAASIEALSAAKSAEAYKRASDTVQRLNETLDDKIYRLTHTAKENAIYQLEKEIQQYSKQLQDAGALTQAELAKLQQYYDASMADINKQYKGQTSRGPKLYDFTGRDADRSIQGAGKLYNFQPNINVSLEGAYVFDESAKQELADDITENVSNALTETIEDMNGRDYSYSE